MTNLSESLTPLHLITATDKLTDALARKSHDANNLAKKKFKLEHLRHTLIAQGNIEGKNQAERDANLYLQTKELNEEVFLYEQAYKEAADLAEIARINFDSIRYEIRLLEATHG